MTDPVPPQWERSVLEKVALKAIEEQRRARQWNVLFKLLWFTVVFLLLASFLGWIGTPDHEASGVSVGRHTAVVDIDGIIGIESEASAERVIIACSCERSNELSARSRTRESLR